MNKLFGFAGALLLTACATAGTNFDWNAVATLRPGMTRSEVVAALGTPNQVVSRNDSTEQLTWSHASASMMGVKSRAVSLTFDPTGKLISVPKTPE